MAIADYLVGFERHLKILQALSEITIRSYRVKVEGFFVWLDDARRKAGREDCRLEDIARHDVEAYMEWCFYKGNGNATRFTKLIALQKFFRYLVYAGVLREDIIAIIPRPRIVRKFVQKFTRAEILGLFRVINIMTEAGIRDAVILILAVFCGLRINEIVNLTMNDIVDDDGCVSVNIQESKHKSSRSIYLWKAPSMFVNKWFVMRLAQGAGARDPLLIAYRDTGRRGNRTTGLSAVSIFRLIKKYALKSGIRKVRVHPHMFRATHASDLRHVRGYDIAAIAERLGHKHISSTDRYLPSRDRIHREYRNLAAYWHEFPHVWTKKEEVVDGTDKAGARPSAVAEGTQTQAVHA